MPARSAGRRIESIPDDLRRRRVGPDLEIRIPLGVCRLHEVVEDALLRADGHPPVPRAHLVGGCVDPNGRRARRVHGLDHHHPTEAARVAWAAHRQRGRIRVTLRPCRWRTTPPPHSRTLRRSPERGPSARIAVIRRPPVRRPARPGQRSSWPPVLVVGFRPARPIPWLGRLQSNQASCPRTALHSGGRCAKVRAVKRPDHPAVHSQHPVQGEGEKRSPGDPCSAKRGAAWRGTRGQ